MDSHSEQVRRRSSLLLVKGLGGGSLPKRTLRLRSCIHPEFDSAVSSTSATSPTLNTRHYSVQQSKQYCRDTSPLFRLTVFNSPRTFLTVFKIPESILVSAALMLHAIILPPHL